MPEWFGKDEEPAPPQRPAGPRALLAVMALVVLATGGAVAYFLASESAPNPVTAQDPPRALADTSEPEAPVPAPPAPEPEAQIPAPLAPEPLPPAPQPPAPLTPEPPSTPDVDPPSEIATADVKAGEPLAAAVAPFDRSAASKALTAAAAQAASCGKTGGNSGTANVRLTFAPSGRVSVAQVVGPPFAGTVAGSCIAASMRSARVPAFSGDAVTVNKSVRVD